MSAFVCETAARCIAIRSRMYFANPMEILYDIVPWNDTGKLPTDRKAPRKVDLNNATRRRHRGKRCRPVLESKPAADLYVSRRLSHRSKSKPETCRRRIHDQRAGTEIRF